MFDNLKSSQGSAANKPAAKPAVSKPAANKPAAKPAVNKPAASKPLAPKYKNDREMLVSLRKNMVSATRLKETIAELEAKYDNIPENPKYEFYGEAEKLKEEYLAPIRAKAQAAYDASVRQSRTFYGIIATLLTLLTLFICAVICYFAATTRLGYDLWLGMQWDMPAWLSDVDLAGPQGWVIYHLALAVGAFLASFAVGILIGKTCNEGYAAFLSVLSGIAAICAVVGAIVVLFGVVDGDNFLYKLLDFLGYLVVIVVTVFRWLLGGLISGIAITAALIILALPFMIRGLINMVIDHDPEPKPVHIDLKPFYASEEYRAAYLRDEPKRTAYECGPYKKAKDELERLRKESGDNIDRLIDTANRCIAEINAAPINNTYKTIQWVDTLLYYFDYNYTTTLEGALNCYKTDKQMKELRDKIEKQNARIESQERELSALRGEVAKAYDEARRARESELEINNEYIRELKEIERNQREANERLSHLVDEAKWTNELIRVKF